MTMDTRSSPSSTTPSTTASRSSASSSSFITSGPLVAMVLEGDEAVRAARQVIGATNPLEATTGSIRGDFAIEVGQNMVHGSDSAGVRRARGERCSSPTSDPRLRARRSGGRSSSRRASRSRSGSPASRRRPRGDPREVALENARRKALRGGAPGELVLGADTRRRARRRHPRQAARRGAGGARSSRASPAARTRSSAAIALARGGESPRRSRSPRSTSARLDRATVDWYVEVGEWEGRAGGYAIQGRGAALVTGIRGDYLNVVGLPLARLLELHPDLHPATPISRGSGAGRSVDCRRPRATPRASATVARAAVPPHGLLLVPHRLRRPRHGGRPRHRQHARLRARARHRAVRAVGGRDRLAHRRGPRRRDRGQAHARPHARARSPRSGRSRTA